MFTEFIFSQETRDIISRLKNLKPPIELDETFTEAPSVDILAFLNYLKHIIIHNKKQQFLIELLYNAILKDFLNTLPPLSAPAAEKKKGLFSRFKFLLLALSGTIYFGCEGFDGITAILSITSLPPMAVFGAGVMFFMLSIAVFHTFGLVDIANDLGVEFRHAPKIVNLYHNELQLLKSLRKQMDQGIGKKKLPEIEHELALAQLLQQRYQTVDRVSLALNKALNSPKLKIAKVITTAVAGVIFFSGGFFAGQTVSIAVAALFLVAATPTFWPVMLASFTVGFMALSIYWYVERPALESRIGRWVGLDKDKLEKLIDREEMEREKTKFDNLVECLTDKHHHLSKITALEKKIETLEQEHHPAPSPFFQPASQREQHREIPAGYEMHA